MKSSIYSRGAQDTICLVCGYMFGSWAFDKLISNLCEFNLVIIEEVGSRNGDFNSFANEADELYQELTANELGRVILIGHSMGGFFAQRFAQLYPDKVKGLVLLATCTPCDFSSSYRLSSGGALSELFSLSKDHFVGLTINSLFSKKYLSVAENYENVKQEIFSSPPELKVCKNQLEATYFEIESEVSISKSEASNVLIVIPESDRIIPKETSLGLLKIYPNAAVDEVEGEHMFFYESPDLFNRSLILWVGSL